MINAKLPLTAAVLLLSINSGHAVADVDTATLEKLVAQIETLTQRVKELEAADREFENKTADAPKAKKSWTDKIVVKGDFRYRMENIDQEGNAERDRQRIRARAAIVAKPSDGLELGLGFATGGDDPVSTNQTLGGGGSTKGLNLDLAYFKYSGLGDASIIAGKFKNFLVQPSKNQLMWDGDWNPEGFGITWANDLWFTNVMGSWIESDSKNSNSEFSYILQAGINNKFESGSKLTAGVTYTDFGTAGKDSFFGDDDDFFGNSFDPVTNTYLYNYEELEFFAEYSFAVGGNPVSVFADYVTNLDAGEFDTGYALGFNVGSAKAAGTWKFGWMYKDIEADAVFGLLNDSDFAGGGTNGKGHILKGSYAIAKNWNANFTYFANETGASPGSKKDYDRLQLDLSFKY